MTKENTHKTSVILCRSDEKADTAEMEDSLIQVCGIEPESIVDGPGFRYVLFVQGCPHHCDGCHNPESWEFDAGKTMTADEIFKQIKDKPNLEGVTFSGGEPFEQVQPLIILAKLCKDAGLTVMSYSGYTLEELQSRRDPNTDELLGLIDILVDGRYNAKLRSLTMKYAGSENQRVIDMRKTREEGEVVLYRSAYDCL